MTAEDYATLTNVQRAEDAVEEPRVFDGNRLMQESYSSVSLGRRVKIEHLYEGNKCCGFDLVVEDL